MEYLQKNKIYNYLLVGFLFFSFAFSANASVNANNYFLKPDKTRQIYQSQRPRPEDRLFHSKAVEKKITETANLLKNNKLRWMFTNCFPNTLDTTVHYRDEDGDDTFVYTGDIAAMWLRDSSAQVWPYVPLANEDESLRKMIRGLLLRQWKSIKMDPYANAFNDPNAPDTQWSGDVYGTDNPEIHERKWEIDSHCYPIRLAHAYWKTVGDDSIFGDDWIDTIELILQTFIEQQRKDGTTPYVFLRVTDRTFDTLSNVGRGNPVKANGLIVSAFRPSDDATTFQFLIPSNFFAVQSLRKAAEILTTVNKNQELADRCTTLANEVENALKEHAVYNHPVFGEIYAYEVDGFGNHLLMDDANVPGLLSMAYLQTIPSDDPIYQNTRRFVLSEYNPYFHKGEAGEGIGSPHIGYEMIWPMSIMMRAFTSNDDAEIKASIEMLMNTNAGTGFMHESFHKDDATNFTREWFAWQNTLFGELILTLIERGKLDLLNEIK